MQRLLKTVLAWTVLVVTAAIGVTVAAIWLVAAGIMLYSGWRTLLNASGGALAVLAIVFLWTAVTFYAVEYVRSRR